VPATSSGAPPIRNAQFSVYSRASRLLERELMGWATHYLSKLRAGEAVSFRPRGQSMTGRIESGQLCTVVPIDPTTLRVGDIVLCKVGGNEYLHLVNAIEGARFQIANNRGFINGWIGAHSIFGKCVRVEP
jgi:hypothetical protein